MSSKPILHSDIQYVCTTLQDIQIPVPYVTQTEQFQPKVFNFIIKFTPIFLFFCMPKNTFGSVKSRDTEKNLLY